MKDADYMFNPDCIEKLDNIAIMSFLTNFTEIAKESFVKVENDYDVIFMCTYLIDFHDKLIKNAVKRKLIKLK